MMTSAEIIEVLPYDVPFLFVDAIHSFTMDEIKGSYTFKEEEYFYQGHFIDNPVTPGVILIECMAQIGLVCLGIVNLERKIGEGLVVGMSNADVDFLKPVYPGTKVIVESKKEYFRFGKMKCLVKMRDESGEVLASGSISGMLLKGET